MGCCSSASTVRSSSSKAQETETIVTLTETTAEERALTQLKLIFDSVDANDDGTVSKDELTAALSKDASLGAFIKEAGFNLNTDLRLLDTNKDKCVSWEEFQKHFKQEAIEEIVQTGQLAAAEVPADEKVIRQLKAIFDSLDTNEDGSVSKDELEAKLRADTDENGSVKADSFGQLVQEAGSSDSFIGTFEKLDTNSDERITWEEFEKHLRETAKQEVKETGDVAGAVEVEERDNKVCCGCC